MFDSVKYPILLSKHCQQSFKVFCKKHEKTLVAYFFGVGYNSFDELFYSLGCSKMGERGPKPSGIKTVNITVKESTRKKLNELAHECHCTVPELSDWLDNLLDKRIAQVVEEKAKNIKKGKK